MDMSESPYNSGPEVGTKQQKLQNTDHLSTLLLDTSELPSSSLMKVQ